MVSSKVPYAIALKDNNYKQVNLIRIYKDKIIDISIIYEDI